MRHNNGSQVVQRQHQRQADNEDAEEGVTMRVRSGRKSVTLPAAARNTRAATTNTAVDILKSRVASFLFIDTDTPPPRSRTDGHGNGGGATAVRTFQINDISQFDDVTVWVQLRNATRLVVNDEDSKMTSLPRALFDVTTLTSLSLVSTSLKELPSDLAKLKLVSLQLTDNKNLRSISAAVKGMVTLRELELHNNTACRLPRSLHRLAQLVTLRAHACKPGSRSALPDGLVRLGQLEHLAYTQCALTKLPRSMGAMTSSLLQLDLSQNKLRVLPDALGALTALQELRVSSNQLCHLPNTLAHLVRLRRLYLASNRFASVPEVVGQLTALNYLNARKNTISSVHSLPRDLRVLLLDDNELNSIPRAVCSCTFLDTLSLDNNRIVAVDDAVLGTLKLLKSLSLAGNKGLGCIPAALTLMPALRRVDLRQTDVKHLPTSLAASLRHLSVFNIDESPSPSDNDATDANEQQGGLSALIEHRESVISGDRHAATNEDEDDVIHM